MATEVERGELPSAVLHAIAAGKTKHNEIRDWIGADPTRTLDRLVRMRLVERIFPVTETTASRRRIYRIADQMLAFYLGIVNRVLPEIERGLGPTILPSLMASLDDHLGGPWEAAFRDHLRRMAVTGELDPQVVAVGPFWTADGQNEIDAVVLAGRSRRPTYRSPCVHAKRFAMCPLVCARSLPRTSSAAPRMALFTANESSPAARHHTGTRPLIGVRYRASSLNGRCQRTWCMFPSVTGHLARSARSGSPVAPPRGRRRSPASPADCPRSRPGRPACRPRWCRPGRRYRGPGR